MRDSFRESANHYSETVRNSKDPLMGFVRDLAGGVGDVGGRLRDTFTGRGGSEGQDGGSGPANGSAGKDDPGSGER